MSQSETKTSPAKLASNRAWKDRNRERVRELSQKRNSSVRADPEEWAKKLERDRQYRKRTAEARKAYDRSRDRIKTAARSTVRNRIYRGTMQRGACEICGEPKSHAHHDDYSKPLEVRWLCSTHHAEAHHE